MPDTAPTPARGSRSCIDEREESFRRHIVERLHGESFTLLQATQTRFEQQDMSTPGWVETFGVPGFFGLPIRYKNSDAGVEEVVEEGTTVVLRRRWTRT